MMFNYDFMIDRYPTFEDNLTTEFFLNWFGAINFVAYVGILYMGFKGLDRGFFAYAIPVVLLQLIWVIMSIQLSGSENYTGLYAWIFLSALLIISRIRAGFPFTYESAGTAFAWRTSSSDPSSAAILQNVAAQPLLICSSGLLERSTRTRSTPFVNMRRRAFGS